MSNERKPLLSDDDAKSLMAEHNIGRLFTQRFVTNLVRDYYERLITEGKLRVVEEVEFSSEKRNWVMCSNQMCRQEITVQNAFDYNYCPGCGNKIKR